MVLKKIPKLPGYLQGFRKRIQTIGFLKMLKELINYNKYYYKLLQKNGVPVNYKTILYHTSFYTKVCRMKPRISQDELINYIPTSVTHGVYRKLKINRREIAYDKYKMYLRMHNAGIDIPEIYYITDDGYENIWDSQINYTQLQKLSKKIKVLAKPRFANAGKGIHLFNGGKIKTNHVYQEFINNHPDIVQLQKTSFCSTVRFVAYNKKGIAQHVSAYLRINRGSIADSGIYGSIIATIEMRSGKIISNGAMQNGTTFEYHPVSNIRIKGFQIPNWEKCLQNVEQICGIYPELPLIAMDIAITQNGCKVLEINAGCGTIFLQYKERLGQHDFVKDYYPL